MVPKGQKGHKGQKLQISHLSACPPVRVRTQTGKHAQAGALAEAVPQAFPLSALPAGREGEPKNYGN